MNTYFKSFVTLDHQPVTTTYIPESNSRVICQTLDNVLENKELVPNTEHSQLKKRLCVSHIKEGYAGTYRPEGLIFETEAKPDYVIPFDFMALTSGKTLTSADYNAKLIEGYEKFQYKSIDNMFDNFRTSKEAVLGLNKFRKEKGLSEINVDSMKYNECCFEQNIQIKPVALIGQNEIYSSLARKYNLRLYKSIEDMR